MPNLSVMYSATFPTKPGKRRLRDSGQIRPINMSRHYYNKKTKAKSNKVTNYIIYGTAKTYIKLYLN